MKRKMIVVLIFIAAMLTPLFAQTENDFEVKQNTDNTLTIIDYKGTVKDVIIPDTLYGLKVTIIGGSAFLNKGLTSVVLPDTVTVIADGSYVRLNSDNHGAFFGNDELAKVTLGKGIKTIGAGAFSSCGLTKVTFNNGLQTIGNNAFKGNEIVELNLPSSIKTIGDGAFSYNKIQKIIFGTGLQMIDKWAFRDNQIVELNLPSSLKTIGDVAFAYNQIESVVIPNGVTDILLCAFSDNPITTVVIPASLAKGHIDDAFGYASPRHSCKITRITIPAAMDERNLIGGFEDAFINFWKSQNKAGGTYVKRGPIWSKE